MALVIRTTVTVYCDGKVHGNPLELTYPHSPSLTEIRLDMKTRGWRVRNHKTYCKEHTP